MASKRSLRKKYTITAGQYSLKLGHHTRIMGILNLTPDSFSQDGLYANPKNTVKRASRLAKQLVRNGADIIDIGGESTRPGAKKISEKEEIERVIPTIKHLSQTLKVPISVDTYKTRVARHALDAGATIVNNIMGTPISKSLAKMVKNYNAAIVLMHIRGTPRTMQRNTIYTNLLSNIKNALQNSIEISLENGIKSDRIIIDPGIGFGKTVEQNLEIINQLNNFKSLNQPLLLGTSRKSFIGNILNCDVKKRLAGTIASVCASISNGAHIVRVHDVKPIKEATLVTDAIINSKH